MKKPVFNVDGWSTLQEPNARKHILGISIRSEDGSVKELRIRHNDGEETAGKIYKKGEILSLPMRLSDFEALFTAGELDIK